MRRQSYTRREVVLYHLMILPFAVAFVAVGWALLLLLWP